MTEPTITTPASKDFPWMKILAVVLWKLGHRKVVITEEEINTALAQLDGHNMVCHERFDCIEVYLEKQP